MFHVELSEDQLKEIRSLLANYFEQKVRSDMHALFDEKGWGSEKIDEWSKEHMRSKYKDA